jgi:putative addiction module CopG family antidote
MNVNLGSVFDSFIADLLKTGLYRSQREVVREGLRLLKELRLSELRKEIAIATHRTTQASSSMVKDVC